MFTKAQRIFQHVADRLKYPDFRENRTQTQVVRDIVGVRHPGSSNARSGAIRFPQDGRVRNFQDTSVNADGNPALHGAIRTVGIDMLDQHMVEIGEGLGFQLIVGFGQRLFGIRIHHRQIANFNNKFSATKTGHRMCDNGPILWSYRFRLNT